jgi:hypothetical protein
MRVVEGGRALQHAAAYGRPHQNVLQYVETQRHDYVSGLTELGRAQYDQAIAHASTLVDSHALVIADALRARTESFTQVNSIHRLSTYEEVQNAPQEMVRWLMVAPEIRDVYHDQRCHGFGERYVDLQPGVSRWDHDDYCRVYSGQVNFDDEGPLVRVCVVGDDDEIPLSTQQKLDIRYSIDVMVAGFAEGIDTTDELNGALG